MDVDEPVIVVDYDPRWAEAARQETDRLIEILAGDVEIEHIGSTAVPECAAKPIVDLLVGTSLPRLSTIADAIAASGYESLGEAEPGRIYLRRREGQNVNAHVVERGGAFWSNDLAFRDYLRAHPDERNRYAAAKRNAASAQPMLLAYSEEKSRVMADLLEQARG